MDHVAEPLAVMTPDRVALGRQHVDKRVEALFADDLKRMEKRPGFVCHFDQVMEFTDGGGQQYAGELAILKPGHFRWQYDKPYEQLYVGDGSMIWHYEPDLMQAERLTDLEAVNPVVMQMLNGTLPLHDIRVIDYREDADLHMRRFQIEVKGDLLVWLGFSDKGDLMEIEREDLLHNRNRMQFTRCSYVAPAAKLFIFSPPAGVDVVDLRSGQ